MHMANELLSGPVAAGSFGIAGAGLAYVCRKAKETITAEKYALMGIMGAFVFAAQMVNIRLPLMPGTSGHLVGAVLLSILLGPAAGAIVISSVVIIQCLIFQDGGILALGCNIINMGLVPSFLGYVIFKAVYGDSRQVWRIYAGAIAGCFAAVEAGAMLVPVAAGLSGVVKVPFGVFLWTMVGVHAIIGVIEGLITAAVLAYVVNANANLVEGVGIHKERLSKGAVFASLLGAALIIGTVLSLFASSMPDGLEWSYAERPGDESFEPIVENNSELAAKADEWQEKYALLPDYTRREAAVGKTADEAGVSEGEGQSAEASAGWTSFAAVVGSVLTMGAVWGVSWVLRQRSESRRKTG